VNTAAATHAVLHNKEAQLCKFASLGYASPLIQEGGGMARVWLAALVLAVASPMAGASAHENVLVCTNPASGVNWRIKIDYLRSTVDSQPARIDEDEITWFDKHDGGTYTLQRKSGELQFVAPSSTGGYFIQDHCTALKTAGSG
jgi:hypothetical protein